MKAVRIHTYSDAMDNLVVEDVEKPVPGGGEVLVRMQYAPVNPSDFNYIRGDYREALSRVIWNQGEGAASFEPGGVNPHPEPPYTLGGEGVGTVEATGAGLLARRLQGKRVALAAGPPSGSWQEYTVVDAKKAVPVPAGIDDQQAAMYLVNPLSCYAMVIDVLKLQPGTWLLQSGAASALGQMVIRLGKRVGFRTINLVRSQANRERLESMGADVVIDTSSQDLLTEVYRATGGQGVACAMDCIGGELLTRMLQCLSPGGHMVVYGTLSGLSNTFYSRDLMMPSARVSGFLAPNWLAGKSLWQKLGTLKALASLHREGVFETEVDQVLHLEEAARAVQLASAPGQRGKILLGMA